MSPPEQDEASAGGFSLGDLMLVLRCAIHSRDPAAVDASWRILSDLFPLDDLTARSAGRPARVRAPKTRRRA